MSPRSFTRATAVLSVAILLTGSGCTAPESHKQVKVDAPKEADSAPPIAPPVVRKTQVEPQRDHAPAVQARVPAVKPKPLVVAQPEVIAAPAEIPAGKKPPLTAPTALTKPDVPTPAPTVVPESKQRVQMAASSLPAPAPASAAAPVQPPVPVPVPVPASAAAPAAAATAAPAQNPYLVPQQVGNPTKEWGEMIDGVKERLNPSPSRQGGSAKDKGEGFLGPLKLPEISQLVPGEFFVLPKIKTVYPTGEKPLVIVTFKCPTEIIGITPLPTKALHDIVTWGMDSINGTNLLDFNMQQVCQ